MLEKDFIKGKILSFIKGSRKIGFYWLASISISLGSDTTLSMPYLASMPFILTLFSIALGPLLFPSLWHKNENKILGFLGVIGIFLLYRSSPHACEATNHLFDVFLHEYIPFIILLFSLYIISHGVEIRIKNKGGRLFNTLFMAGGALLSNIVGTTGASMLLIKPFIKINQHRKYQAHTIIFYIFLIGNLGGCLTPIGDPPLFLGYLNGVHFFWPLKNLWIPYSITLLSVLILYFFIDSYLNKEEGSPSRLIDNCQEQFSINGKINIFYILILVILIIITGKMTPEPIFYLGKTPLFNNQLLRDGSLLFLTFISYKTTPSFIHKRQHLTWGPISEVARVFAVIFITMIPVSIMLKQGLDGPFSSLFQLFEKATYKPFIYFWLTGSLSAFLDNAPTYLIFFDLAGGEATRLMNQDAEILMAISMGSVFMGALTYIGNAPNFMIRSIAKQSGIIMPSFLGYMVWSILILTPIFLGVTLWFFR